MSLHVPSEMGMIEARARRRYERYREHWESEHWHIGTVPPEWDHLHYLERIVLLKTETDMWDDENHHLDG